MVECRDAFGAVLSELSDATRRSIIARLAERPTRVTDIAAPYSMSLNAVSKHLKVLEQALNAVSKHLKVLEQAGLVQRSLMLNARPLREVARWTLNYERLWSAKLDQLESVFAVVQPVIDGLFYHLVSFEGHDWAHYGRFVALNRPSCIEHTWVSEATRGLESVVSLTFEAQDEGTLLTLSF